MTMRQATLEFNALTIRLVKGLIKGWERWLRQIIDEDREGNVKEAGRINNGSANKK
jgi:hypothetical protein